MTKSAMDKTTEVDRIPLMKFRLCVGCSVIVTTSFPSFVVTAFRDQLKVMLPG